MEILRLCVLIILVLGILNGCVKQEENQLASRFTTTIKYSTIDKCIEYRKNLDKDLGDYKKGLVIAIFIEGTTNEQIRKVIENNGLEVEAFYSNRPVANIVVPEGSEYYWACKLENNPIVEELQLEFPVIYGEG